MSDTEFDLMKLLDDYNEIILPDNIHKSNLKNKMANLLEKYDKKQTIDMLLTVILELNHEFLVSDNLRSIDNERNEKE